MRMGFALACLPLMLAACERPPAQAQETAAAKTPQAAPSEPAPASDAASAPLFSDPALGIEIAPVEDMSLHRDFGGNYFMDPGEWKAFAAPDSHGTPVAALVVDGSNDITTAELRIGVSDDPQEVAHCRDLPEQADPSDKPQEVQVSGVPFLRFRAGDAGMSHHINVESYRAVHESRCYAIDLMVFGTSPDVFDPPRQAPFSDDDAQQHLRQALSAIRLR